MCIYVWFVIFRGGGKGLGNEVLSVIFGTSLSELPGRGWKSGILNENENENENENDVSSPLSFFHIFNCPIVYSTEDILQSKKRNHDSPTPPAISC